MMARSRALRGEFMKRKVLYFICEWSERLCFLTHFWPINHLYHCPLARFSGWLEDKYKLGYWKPTVRNGKDL